MQLTVDVFVVGKEPVLDSVPAEWEPQVSFRLIPTAARSIGEFPHLPILKQFMDGDGEFSALIYDTSRETLSAVANSARGMARDAKIHRAAKTDAFSQIARLAIERIDPGLFAEFLTRPSVDDSSLLLAPRARHGATVFRRNAFQEVGPLHPVAEPIWDWMIRAARAGKKIGVAESIDLKSSSSRLPMLAPHRPVKDANWLLEHLVAASSKELGGNPLSKVDEIARRAGLFQWHDFLNESHELSQSIEGQGEEQLGDYWHAIMHRREPDYSNAKYWFRRIGNQPAYRDLRLHADTVLSECRAPQAAVWRDRLQAGEKWNPLAFVDLCEECAADETSDLAIAARRIQFAEMCLLM